MGVRHSLKRCFIHKTLYVFSHVTCASSSYGELYRWKKNNQTKPFSTKNQTRFASKKGYIMYSNFFKLILLKKKKKMVVVTSFWTRCQPSHGTKRNSYGLIANIESTEFVHCFFDYCVSFVLQWFFCIIL